MFGSFVLVTFYFFFFFHFFDELLDYEKDHKKEQFEISCRLSHWFRICRPYRLIFYTHHAASTSVPTWWRPWWSLFFNSTHGFLSQPIDCTQTSHLESITHVRYGLLPLHLLLLDRKGRLHVTVSSAAVSSL